MFSAGLFIKTHLVFLTDIFRRKTSPLIPADIESLKNGQSALNAALNTTYENILQLEQLEQMIFTKYPELINDKSFTKNLSTLKNRLNKNYNKLIKKQETIEKYIKKTNKHIKILKKEKKKDDK